MRSSAFSAALRAAGLKPDSFLPEYGQRQYEFTIAPEPALKAADQAVTARELVRATAFRLGHRAIFSPMPVADGAGNGVQAMNCMLGLEETIGLGFPGLHPT